uniref:(northern house mosquito) hypothetical protein n=1 Tax=Culex pipiens TaxID=7175 RepID=A0A8D7ZSI0_CULPI
MCTHRKCTQRRCVPSEWEDVRRWQGWAPWQRPTSRRFCSRRRSGVRCRCTDSLRFAPAWPACCCRTRRGEPIWVSRGGARTQCPETPTQRYLFDGIHSRTLRR